MLGKNIQTRIEWRNILATKPYNRGLVVGKFSPFHKGHELLIQRAKAQCDELVIISYSRPEFPSCPAPVREKWLREFCPSATILCVDAPLIESWKLHNSWHLEMPDNAEEDNTHRAFTFSLLRDKLNVHVDAVFTSEEYGDGFAEFLSAPDTGFGSDIAHECVDLDRVQVPVGGTLLRSWIAHPDQLIRDSVLREFGVQKICILGGESTGKSTLAATLADHYQEPLVTEYGRELWDRMNGVLTPENLIDICEIQTRNEDSAQVRAKKLIFCDTSPLTTLCYSEALFNERPGIIEAYSERPYHHVFLCEPDFPFVQDGTRRDGEFRNWQHEWYLRELKQRGVRYKLLNGKLEERLSKVIFNLGQGMTVI